MGNPVNNQEAVRFILEPITALSRVEALWKSLDRGGSHSFFCSWTWIGNWLRLLPPDCGTELLTARRGTEMIGAAVLVRRKARRHGIIHACQIHFNSTGNPALDCITIEHNGFAGPGARDPDLWKSFIAWFERGDAHADELVVPGICDGLVSPALADIKVLQRRREVKAFRVERLSELLGDGGIEARLSRNSRQQLRRSLRAYASLGTLRIDVAKTEAEANAYFDALKEFHIPSWTGRGKVHAFRHPFFERFHRALISRGFATGAVRLLKVSAGNEVIGYLYDFSQGRRIYAYQSGFSSRNTGFRPGYVCHALAMEHYAAQGAEDYDFLAGENQLKRTFNNASYMLGWWTFQQPKMRFRAEDAVRSVAKIARRRS